MGKKRILVVDDESDIVEALRIMLEANNYEVLVAYDGLEALKKARQELPDLIILDLMLPQMNGYKVCRRLKYDLKYKHIPIIMLTVKSQLKDMEMGFASEADDYVTKPFDPQDLLDRIKEQLGET